MFSGWRRFVVVLAILIIASTFFRQPWWVVLPMGMVLGGFAALYGWYQEKNRIYTQQQIAAAPFNGKLPVEIGLAIEDAVALEGDDSYSQRVYGEHFFAHNFEDLRQYAQVPDGTLLEVQSALVVEPANPDSQHAVAVTCGGVVLGYIPELQSEGLYRFLFKHRGIGRVNSNIYFDISGGKSFVEIDLSRPYRIARGA
ncbi:MAG: hypothetical protein ACKORF_03880 [Micrococcales bacterium]